MKDTASDNKNWIEFQQIQMGSNPKEDPGSLAKLSQEVRSSPALFFQKKNMLTGLP